MPVNLGLLLTDDLPEEPVLAMEEIVHRIRKVWKDESGLAADEIQISYFVLVNYASKCGVLLRFGDDHNPTMQSLNNLLDEIEDIARPFKAKAIQTEAEAEVERILARKGLEPGYAVLSAAEKTEIASKVEFIRQIIEASALNTKKKNVLIKKLNRFSVEVMKDGTDTDALFAFLGELSLHAGQMAKNAKPALDELKDILRIVFRNRAAREGLSLPSPEDILKLPDFSDE